LTFLDGAIDDSTPVDGQDAVVELNTVAAIASAVVELRVGYLCSVDLWQSA
jgi:hypothetical protein